MKEKIKRFGKRYLIGFITGIVVCGGVSVIAATYFPSNQVTYENGTSGMAATDVQGAIDELYNVCFPPTGSDTITDLLPSNPDELYKDEHGDIRYYGAYPNNYVSFNNELWRIIGVIDGKIKIIRNESIGSMAWNSASSNNWNNASLNSYLNGEYYNGLNSTAQGQIVSKDFSIGAVTYNDTNLSNSINNENSKKWNGKVALATASEYIRSNSNQSSCGNMNQLWTSISCRNTTWMDNSDSWWTLSPDSDYSYSVFFVDLSGFFDSRDVDSSRGVRPVVYLRSDVQITGGDGSQNNPYILS